MLSAFSTWQLLGNKKPGAAAIPFLNVTSVMVIRSIYEIRGYICVRNVCRILCKTAERNTSRKPKLIRSLLPFSAEVFPSMGMLLVECCLGEVEMRMLASESETRNWPLGLLVKRANFKLTLKFSFYITSV